MTLRTAAVGDVHRRLGVVPRTWHGRLVCHSRRLGTEFEYACNHEEQNEPHKLDHGQHVEEVVEMTGLVEVGLRLGARQTAVDVAEVSRVEPESDAVEDRDDGCTQEAADPRKQIKQPHDDPLHRLGRHGVGKL